jgi:hypothetical protein
MMRRTACCLLLFTAAIAVGACKPSPSEPLGPADSYVLLRPGDARSETAGPVVERLDGTEAEAVPLAKVLLGGFGAEMMRTVYVAKHFLVEARPEGQAFDPAAVAAGREPLAIVLGVDRAGPVRGLALTGPWFGGPLLRPNALWIGLPAKLDEDPALVQTFAARVAAYLGTLAATAGRFGALDPPSQVLVDGYRMAMEVIAREWRTEAGPRGNVDTRAGTEAQRRVFASVREGRFALTADRKSLRPPRELMADPGVAATFIYRMAQSPKVLRTVAEPSFYAPFASDQIPPGMSPAVVLGEFRNFQAKLIGVWALAVQAGKPPRTIADLVRLYGARFPEERREAVRVFLFSTMGATAKVGGFFPGTGGPVGALAELTALAAEIDAGKRSLTEVLDPPRDSSPAKSP